MPFFSGDACPGVPDGLAEAHDRLGIGVGDDLPQGVAGLGFGVAQDDEAVEAEADLVRVPSLLGRQPPNLADLLRDLLHAVAVHEVPVGHAGGHPARRHRVAALEDLGMRPLDGLRLQGRLVDPVEVALEGEGVLRPQALEDADELLGAAVALVVVEPGLAVADELALEPAADDVHGGAAVADVVDRRHRLGDHPRVPQARMDGRDQLDPLRHGGERRR
jgi:hypothetical protein